MHFCNKIIGIVLKSFVGDLCEREGLFDEVFAVHYNMHICGVCCGLRIGAHHNPAK